jgi:hypothetical protein
VKSRAAWKAAALLVVLGMALHLPAVRWGFLWDDFLHQGVLRYSEMIPEVSPLNLYDYRSRPQTGETLGDLGVFPWWTSDDFRVRFFRPVTSASITLDYLLYGGWAPGYHFTSILLFGLLLVLSGMLYHGLGCGRIAATFGLAFLALDDIHVLPVGWIANRNAVLANIFLVGTLLGVNRYCRRGSRGALAGAVISFFLACGSKETALITVALVPSYLFFLHPASGQETLAASLRRVLRSPVLWLFVGLGGLYAGGYHLSGYGTNSALYTIPWQDRGAFAARIGSFFPVAGGSLFFGASADLVYVMPHLRGTLALVLLFPVGALLAAMWKRLRSQKAAWFAVSWMLVALLPAAGVPTSDRLLVDASLGSALLLGLFVEDLLSEPGRPGLSRRARRALCLLLLFLGPLLAAPMAWVRGNGFYRLAAADRTAIGAAEISLDRGTPRQVVLLNPPSTVLALTTLATWTVLHDDPGPSVTSLQMARRPWGWRRVGERSLVVSFGPPPSSATGTSFSSGPPPPLLPPRRSSRRAPSRPPFSKSLRRA